VKGSYLKKASPAMVDKISIAKSIMEGLKEERREASLKVIYNKILVDRKLRDLLRQIKQKNIQELVTKADEEDHS
jgi:hypothetical protein